MNWKYVISWIPGVPIAIVNGTIRQFGFRMVFDELPAHQLSVVTFIILFGIYVSQILPWLKLNSKSEAVRVGLTWLGITIAFEFVFGHFVLGHTWETLFHDYNLLAGRLWVVVLAWTALSPLILYRRRDPHTVSAA